MRIKSPETKGLSESGVDFALDKNKAMRLAMPAPLSRPIEDKKKKASEFVQSIDKQEK